MERVGILLMAMLTGSVTAAPSTRVWTTMNDFAGGQGYAAGATLWESSPTDAHITLRRQQEYAPDPTATNNWFSRDPGEGRNWRVMRFDTAGNQMFSVDYNSPASDDDAAHGIGLLPGGGFVAAGWEERPDISQSWDIRVRRYDNAGNLVSEHSYNDPNNAQDQAFGIAADPVTGDYAVAGFELRSDLIESFNAVFRLHDSAGNLKSMQSYNNLFSPLAEEYRGVAFNSKSGGWASAGYQTDTTGGMNWLVSRYTAAGALSWTRTYGATDGADDMALAVATSPVTGNIVAAGYQTHNLAGQGLDWLIRIYSPAGAFVNEIGCDAPLPSQDDGATAAVIDLSKNSWVVGWETRDDSGDGENMLLKYYDVSGVLQASLSYTGPVSSGDDRATTVAATRAGGAVFAGYEDTDPGAGIDNRWKVIVIGPPFPPLLPVTWATNFDGPLPGGDDRVTAVAAAPSNSVYIAGYMTFGAPSVSQDWVVKQMNYAGTAVLWTRTLDGAPMQGMGEGGEDHPLAAAIDRPSTSLYVVGYVTDMVGGTGKNWMIRRFGTGGTVMLELSYNGPGSGDDIAYGVGVDGQGNCYVAGEADMGGGDMDWLIQKYDSTGSAVGPPITYGSVAGQYDSARAISVMPDGSFFVAGISDRTDLGEGENWLVRSYDSAGAWLWERTYNMPPNGADQAVAISASNFTAGGRVVIAGTEDRSSLAAGLNWRIEWSNTWGATLQTTQYGSSSCMRDEVATAVAVDSAGNIIAGGWEDRSDLNEGRNWTLRKYTAAGALLWRTSYTGDLPGYDDELTCVAVDATGNVYAGGYAQYAGSLEDYVIRKYDPNGVLLWHRRIDSKTGYFNADIVRGIAVDAAGNVTIVGEEDRMDLTQLTRLPYAVGDHATVGIGNRIYIIGGTEKVTSPCASGGLDQCVAFVRFASIDPTGRVGAWTRANYLFGDAGAASYPFGPPLVASTGIPIIEHAAVAVGNRIYVVGGRTACSGAVPPTANVLDTVFSAVVDPVTGHTSPWEVEIPLAQSGRKMGLVYAGGALYAMGGATDGSGKPTQFVQKAEILPSGKLYSSNKLRWDGVLNLPVGSPTCPGNNLCSACSPSTCAPCSNPCVISSNECLGWTHFTAFSMMRTIAFVGAGYQNGLDGTPCKLFYGSVYGWLGDDNRPVSWQTGGGTAPLVDAQPFSTPILGQGTLLSVGGYGGSSSLKQVLHPPLGVAKGIYRTGGGDNAELRPATPKTAEFFAGLVDPQQLEVTMKGVPAVVYGDYAYLVGGLQSDSYCNRIFRAKLKSTSWYVDAGSWMSPAYDLGTTVKLMRVAWSMSKSGAGIADDWASVRYRVAGDDGVWSVWSPRIPEAGAMPSSTGYYTFASDVPGDQPFFRMPLAPGINRYLQYEVSLYNDNGGASDAAVPGAIPTLPRFDEFRITFEPAPPPPPLKPGCPLEAYPNPAKDRLTVRFEVAPEGGEVTLRIYNTAAQMVGEEKYFYVAGGVVSERLDFTGWANGTYVIVVEGLARGGDPGLYCTQTNARFKRLKEKFVIRR